MYFPKVYCHSLSMVGKYYYIIIYYNISDMLINEFVLMNFLNLEITILIWESLFITNLN